MISSNYQTSQLDCFRSEVSLEGLYEKKPTDQQSRIFQRLFYNTVFHCHFHTFTDFLIFVTKANQKEFIT